MVPQFHAFHVKWGGTEPVGFVHDFVDRDKEKFSILVHELFDQPWTSNTIYFHSFSSNPFHMLVLPRATSLACRRAVNFLTILKDILCDDSPNQSCTLTRQMLAKQRRQLRTRSACLTRIFLYVTHVTYSYY